MNRVRIANNTLVAAKDALYTGIEVSAATQGGSRTTANNQITDVEISQNTILGFEVAIKAQAARDMDLKSNFLSAILIKSNRLEGFQHGISLAGGEQGASENLTRDIRVECNLLVGGEPKQFDIIGISVEGGGYEMSNTNRVENIQLMQNTIQETHFGIWLVGGSGSTGNVVTNIRLADNVIEASSVPVFANANKDEGYGNILEVQGLP